MNEKTQPSLIAKVLNAVRWFFGALALIGLLLSLLNFNFKGILFSLIWAVILIPPAYELYSSLLSIKIPPKFHKLVTLLLLVFSFALVGPSGDQQSSSSSVSEADEAVVRESLAKLVPLFEAYDNARSERQRDSVMNQINELATHTSISEYRECIREKSCFDALLGSVVVLEVSGEYMWSQNSMSARSSYTDFLSGTLKRFPFTIRVRNGSTNEDRKGEQYRYGLDYSLHGHTHRLTVNEVEASTFLVAGVVESSYFDRTSSNTLNGFILRHEVDERKLVSLKRSNEAANSNSELDQQEPISANSTSASSTPGRSDSQLSLNPSPRAFSSMGSFCVSYLGRSKALLQQKNLAPPDFTNGLTDATTRLTMLLALSGGIDESSMQSGTDYAEAVITQENFPIKFKEGYRPFDLMIECADWEP